MHMPANFGVILLFFVISIATTAVSNKTPSNNAEKAIKSLETTLERKLNQLIAVVNATSRGKSDNKPDTSGFASCKEIYENRNARGNRAYPLKMHSGKVFVYCHMTSRGLGACGGGGWTLVMKTDGNKQTFHFNSKLWSNKINFNLPGGKTGLDRHETKLPTYWNTPFSKICLGMMIGHQKKFIVIYKHASSLHSLIADGLYRPSSLGRNKWKMLIGSEGSLQTNCNKEGFNAMCSDKGASKARIGFLGNNENACDSCDSRIGYGTGGYNNDKITCGNEATAGSDKGDKHIKAMGYIFVQ